MLLKKLFMSISLSALCISLSAQASSTLDIVKQREHLKCGVSTGIPGFSSTNDKGQWMGIDVAFCHAVAAAVLGDASKVKFTPLNAKERFTALQSGEIDVLSRNTTWTLTRDASLGLNFVGALYYDGQGFMVKKSLGVSSAKALNGATFCVHAGTTSELNLSDYFKAHNMQYKAVTFDKSEEAAKAFDAGRCDAISSDQSQLYAQRVQLKKPTDAQVLSEIISKEPLGPVVRQGDDQWFNVVKWTLFAMLNAEELGITSKNVDMLKQSSQKPVVRRLLGLEGIKGEGLGLNDDWAYQVIKQVGNYAQVFETTVGQQSRLEIKRGLNALWKDGGIQYAPPLR